MNSAFAARRQKVIESIAPSAMVLFAAPVSQRNNDVEYDYRQDSDFYYLLGFEEPESVLVVTTVPKPQVVLFLRERDASRETWDGPRLGVEAAVQTLGVHEAYPISQLANKLPELLAGSESLYYALDRSAAADQVVMSALRSLRASVRRGGTWPSAIIEPGQILHEMRLRKDETEVAALVKAIEITGRAHECAMRNAHPGCWEFELESELSREFRRAGSPRVAYSSIVASGVNATILHHRLNDRQSRAGELILIDAGCEFGYQSADVTRTFPVDGRFTDVQRRAYEVVLDAQVAAIELVRPGATIDAIHENTVRLLTKGLLDLGILSGNLDDAISLGAYKPYYMHRTSHWLGMDVHDVGRYHVAGQPRPLEPGMVVTIEPGLYFAPGDHAVPDGLKGVGIRIEDDILVTSSGRRNLSEGIAKSVDEIERIMRL